MGERRFPLSPPSFLSAAVLLSGMRSGESALVLFGTNKYSLDKISPRRKTAFVEFLAGFSPNFDAPRFTALGVALGKNLPPGSIMHDAITRRRASRKNVADT